MNAARQKIILVTHRPGPMADRASAHLADKGYTLEWCCPAAGQALPPIDSQVAGAVFYGGPQPVNEADRYPFLKDEMDWIGRALTRDLPVLGFCLGAQLMAHHLGAAVGPHPEGIHEYGYYRILPTAAGGMVFDGELMVFQAHYHSFGLPAGTELLATGDNYPHQAFRFGQKAFGLQFHPEVTRAMLEQWVVNDRASLTKPGACSAERQLRDNLLYGEPLGAWLFSFLDSWIEGAVPAAGAAVVVAGS